MLAKTLRAIAKSNAGLLMVVASEAFYACMAAAVKALTTDTDSSISVFEILLIRMIVTYVGSVAYMYCARINNPILGPPGIRLLLLFRGFAGFFGVFGVYYSLQYLSLSDAIVLTFLAPLCTVVLGSYILKERFTKGEALACIISLLGVVLIARPPFIFGSDNHESVHGVEKGVTAAQRLTAVGGSMIGVLGMTGAYISIRAIGTRAHALHNMTYFSFLCIVQSTMGMIITRSPLIIPKERASVYMLLMIGVFGFIAQMLMTMGYQIEAAGRASMGVYTQVIFALILERAVFGTVPGLLSVLGTTLVLGSALYVALAKARGDEGRIKLKEDAADVENGLPESHEERYTDVNEGL